MRRFNGTRLRGPLKSEAKARGKELDRIDERQAWSINRLTAESDDEENITQKNLNVAENKETWPAGSAFIVNCITSLQKIIAKGVAASRHAYKTMDDVDSDWGSPKGDAGVKKPYDEQKQKEADKERKESADGQEAEGKNKESSESRHG
uniref:Uncharacterized protein n=1 Tax=Parascaris univalens TaxID=6257 RepID=A0A915BRS6_PARUN